MTRHKHARNLYYRCCLFRVLEWRGIGIQDSRLNRIPTGGYSRQVERDQPSNTIRGCRESGLLFRNQHRGWIPTTGNFYAKCERNQPVTTGPGVIELTTPFKSSWVGVSSTTGGGQLRKFGIYRENLRTCWYRGWPISGFDKTKLAAANSNTSVNL